MTSALSAFGSSRTIVRKAFSGTDMTLPAVRLEGIDYEWTHVHWSAFTATNTSILASNNQVIDMAYGAGLYVAVTSAASSGSGLLYTSPDLVTWTARSPSGAFTSVIWTGTQFVARASSTNFFTSPDGITWTTRAEGAAVNATAGLTYISSLGLYVVQAPASSTLYTSPDVVTWTSRSLGSTSYGPGAFGAGVYVVPTEAGMKYTSDFTSFSAGVLKNEFGVTTTWDGGSQNLFTYGIVWDGSKFHAIVKLNTAPALTYITSPDGITWTIVSALVPPRQINGPGNQQRVPGNSYYVLDSSGAGLRRNSTLCVVNGVVFAYLLKHQTFTSGSGTGTSVSIQILRLNGDSWTEYSLGPMVGGSLVGNVLYTGTMRNVNGRLFALPMTSDTAPILAKYELNLNARELVYVL